VLRLELAMMQQRLEEPRQEWERERADKDAMIADLREDRDRRRILPEKLLRTPKTGGQSRLRLGHRRNVG
jgi:hypothetical protein